MHTPSQVIQLLDLGTKPLGNVLFPPRFLSALGLSNSATIKLLQTASSGTLPSQSWGILLGWGWVWYKEQLNYFYSCLCYFFPRAGAHQPQFVVCLLQCLTRIFCLLSHFNLRVPHKKFHSNLYLRNSFSSCDFHVNRIKTKV